MGAREQDTERTSVRRKKKRADSRNSNKKQGEQGDFGVLSLWLSPRRQETALLHTGNEPIAAIRRENGSGNQNKFVPMQKELEKYSSVFV